MMDTPNMDDFFVDDIVDDLKLVENEILANLVSDPELPSRIGRDLLTAGGKRVRPALTLLSYRAAGGTNSDLIVPIAAAIELIHTASLIHDDIGDEAYTRRGLPTAFRSHGRSTALLAGDFLFIKAFRIGGQYDWDVVKIIADACTQLVEGEILQDNSRYNTDLSMERYLVTIQKKTASLITACSRVGALLSGGSMEHVEALTKFAQNIGMAFQITDDILDVKGKESSTGKTVGNDIREGQLSMVTIGAIQELREKDPELGDELASIIRKKENTDEDIIRAISIIHGTDAIDHSYALARDYTEKALEELHRLEETEYRDNLELILEMIIHRYF